MDVTELRVGNLVSQKYLGLKHEGMAVIEDGHYWADMPIFVKDIVGYSKYPENCNPITLTEEWHNNFGVKKNGFNSFEYQIETAKKIIFSGDYIYLRDIENSYGVEGINDNLCTLWSNDKRGRSIYVHEWQNLYFALTGQELTTSDHGQTPL